MASRTYEIAFQLGAKMASSFATTFNAASRNIETLEIQSRAANKGFLGLGEGATKMFKAASGVAAGIGIAEVAKKSIELASNLTEVQNVVDTTFGGSSNQIDSWSQTALNAFGLSQLQAKQFNGTMGALLKSSGITGDGLVNMSEKLSGLSGDFASFYNLPIDEAFEKIKSGISGETEPLKSLGINMSVANLQAYALSNGMTKSYQSMSQAEQTQLRYNYLMNTSKDVQGDFNKTSNTFANQMRITQTNLSQMGASIAVKVLPYLNKLLLLFNNGGISKIGAVFSGAFDKGISIISSLKPNVENLWDSVVKFTQISGLDKIWSSFNPGQAFDTIQSALKNTLDGFTGITDFVNNNFGTIKTVVEGVAVGVSAYGLAIAAVSLQQKGALLIQTLSTAWFVATGIIGAMRNGMALTAIVQNELNLAMAANPIGLITLAIAGLIGIGIVLYKNWGTISTVFSNVWTGVKTTFMNFWNWIKGFLSQWGTVILSVVAPFIGIPLLIVQHWNQIKAGLSSIWSSLKASVSSAWTSIVNAITNSALFKVVSAIFKGILAVVIIVGYNIYKGFTTIWNNVYTTVSKVVTSVWNVIVSTWNTIYSAVANILNSVWSVIVSIWNSIYNSISAILKPVWDFIVSIWNSVYGSVSGIVTNIWNTIVTGFTNAYNGIVSIFGSIKDTVSTIFMDIWNVIKSVINSGIGMINGFIGGVNSVIDVANKVPGVNIGTVGTIPQLANGGYIKHRPGGILANIGEGNEDEIVSPVSKLKNIIGGSNKSTIEQPNFNFTVNLTIQGNASQDDIYQAVSMSKSEFKKMIDDYFKSKQRVSFSN